MLRILGQGERFCDGVTRRSFLSLGSLALGGLSLPQILEAESRLGVRPGSNSHKATIMIFLAGGPPHQDMVDLKPDAPKEVRGPFNPIKTNVPGIEICELLPRLAETMDRYTVIRSLVGSRAGHSSFQCFTGRAPQNQPPGGWPALGSIVSKLEGAVTPGVPPFVGLSHPTSHRPWGDPGPAGFLGTPFAPFRPNGSGKTDLVLNGVTTERLGDRKSLLASFDRFRRQADSSGLMEGMDAFTQQAFGVLTSSQLANALDLGQEDPRVRDRYGRGTTKATADGPPKHLDQFLMARRLVEAGARCVTLAFSRWDWHGNNFGRARQDFPLLDQGLTALVEDLHRRGLDKDVSVVVWGEFGQSPTGNG